MNKKMIDDINRWDSVLWNEVKEFTDLLRKWGLGGGYALTGPVEAPIITRWRISLTSQGPNQTAKREEERRITI